MAEQAESSGVLELTAQIVSAHESACRVFLGNEEVQDERRDAVSYVPFHQALQLKSQPRTYVLQHDARAVSREVAAPARLPDGGAELRQAPLLPGQEDRAGHQAAGPVGADESTSGSVFGYATLGPARIGRLG